MRINVMTDWSLLAGAGTVQSLIGKAKMKTIKVTGVLILGFLLTWFPYQANCILSVHFWVLMFFRICIFDRYLVNKSLYEAFATGNISKVFQKLLWNFGTYDMLVD